MHVQSEKETNAYCRLGSGNHDLHVPVTTYSATEDDNDTIKYCPVTASLKAPLSRYSACVVLQ